MKNLKIHIEPYINSVTTEKTAPKTLTAKRNYINYALDFLALKGLDSPDENFYTALRENLKTEKGLADSNINSIIKDVQNFFSFCADQERNLSIEPASDTEKNSKSNVLNVEQQGTPEIEQEHEQEQLLAEPDENSSQPVEVRDVDTTGNSGAEKNKGKPGRKLKDGVKRSEKVMIYLTPSLYEDLKDLAYIRRTTLADYTVSLIQNAVNSKREKIEAFRQLNDD